MLEWFLYKSKRGGLKSKTQNINSYKSLITNIVVQTISSLQMAAKYNCFPWSVGKKIVIIFNLEIQARC